MQWFCSLPQHELKHMARVSMLVMHNPLPGGSVHGRDGKLSDMEGAKKVVVAAKMQLMIPSLSNLYVAQFT